MGETSKQNYPYKSLGAWLKRLREKCQESTAEVSGAVEIDVATLIDIEQGIQRPSEDILTLLMSHFSVQDSEAAKAWELAGYTNPMSASDETAREEAGQVLVMPFDMRIVYADMAHVSTNEYGVVVNFMQSSGIGNKPLAISRVGMSREHALHTLKLLQKALLQEDTQQQMLPAPDKSTDSER